MRTGGKEEREREEEDWLTDQGGALCKRYQTLVRGEGGPT